MLTWTSQIVFNNRFKSRDEDQQSFITVDCTDCVIEEKRIPFCKIWYSHKSHGPGVRYEIAICIKTGDIVWVSGPFPAGIPDLLIFDIGLAKWLLPNELVEADNGYKGRDNVMIPGAGVDSEQRIAKSKARGRHESVNGRLKFFKGIADKFRHGDHDQHRTMFVAAAVIAQIGFDHNLGLPFDVPGVGNYPGHPVPKIPDGL